MELALSLGDAATPFSFIRKSQKIVGHDLGFCMAVDDRTKGGDDRGSRTAAFSDGRSSDPPVQLDLLPFSPPRKAQPSANTDWIRNKLSAEPEKRRKFGEEGDRESPTAVSSFQMDFPILGWNNRGKRDSEQIYNEEQEADGGGTPSRGSDEEENGSMCRKKLRLSKQQSAFLEESFREHSTLNPKQKLALSKQLNLRPRQVEVWFQNRRARTKLKQTEVDCEYLKRCCETLTEENRRLQKELQELRALKASQPFYMQLPATTLSMCPSCEKVTAAATTTTTTTTTTTATDAAVHLSLSSGDISNAQQGASS